MTAPRRLDLPSDVRFVRGFERGDKAVGASCLRVLFSLTSLPLCDVVLDVRLDLSVCVLLSGSCQQNAP